VVFGDHVAFLSVPATTAGERASQPAPVRSEARGGPGRDEGAHGGGGSDAVDGLGFA
jgi:hypothetical protein